MRAGLRRAAAALGAAAAMVAASALPLPAFVVTAGPVEPAGRYVGTAGRRAGGPPILFPTVLARPARVYDLPAALVPDRALLPRAALLRPGQSLADYLAEGRAQLAESQQVAAYVALRHLGLPARLVRRGGRWRLQTSVPLRLEGAPAAGPSAALAFALELARQLGAGQPPAALAATGALDPDGRVRPVGGVPLKVRAAEAAGAALVLVPAEQADAARAAARRVRVVGVGRFAEAVAAALTGPSGPPYNGHQFGGWTVRIDVRDLRRHRGRQEVHRLSVHQPAIEYRGERIAFRRPTELTVRLTNTGRQLWADVHAEVHGRLRCSRCLREFDWDLDLDYNEEFVAADQVPPEGLADEGDVRVNVYDGEEIDLQAGLEEQILLALPIRWLCHEACRGLCPRCGQDLNEGTCTCEPVAVDPRLAVLRQLLEDPDGKAR